MEAQEKAVKIVNHMLQNDSFSKWLNIVINNIKPGSVKISMMVNDQMTNGHNTTHGGISFSLADSALAFASNSHGQVAVSVETSIAHILPVHIGDNLTAEAKEINRSNKLGRYSIPVTNQNNELVAHFKGTVYFKNKTWDL